MLSVCSRQDSNLPTPSSTGKTHWFQPSKTRCPSLSGISARVPWQLVTVEGHMNVWVLSRSVVSNSLQPMDCSPPGSSVRGIFQARILEWVAISWMQGDISFQTRNCCLWMSLQHPNSRTWGFPAADFHDLLNQFLVSQRQRPCSHPQLDLCFLAVFLWLMHCCFPGDLGSML